MFLPLLFACTSPPATPLDLPPVKPSGPTLRVIAVGDTGHINATARRVARSIQTICLERGCDALLLLGDNIYPRGATDEAHAREAMAPWRAIGLPLYAVLGNHDWGHGHDAAAAAAQIALSDSSLHIAEDWVARAGPATLFGLDTTRVFWDGAARASWLGPALDAADGWRIVLGHHPLRSNGPHGNAGAYEGWSRIPWMSGTSVQTALDGALCGRADLYLSGHDHSRQWLEECGVELVVSGAGSSATTLHDRGNDHRFAAATHGFVWLSAGSSLRVAFYDEDGRLEYEDAVPGRRRLAE